MRNFKQIYALISTAGLLLGSLLLPLQAQAAEAVPVSGGVGPWVVTNLAADNGDWSVEFFKIDRNLIAWTELNQRESLRRLYAFDGVKTKLLASLTVAEWENPTDAGFYDPQSGNFDVADGLVVWVQNDGMDREIMSYNGYQIAAVSNNTYDDKHPITSRSRVAWTSVPGASYNLMVKDAAGTRRVDSYQVMNYAFSGQNLFWLNKRGNENWFRVFRDDGKTVLPVGEGDDRPLWKYFFTDGKGTAAWEYSTKNWSYDKRVVYLSYLGTAARRIIQRDVPPNVTRIEDVDGDKVLLNSHDLLTSLLADTMLIESNGFQDKYLLRKVSFIKARFLDGGIVHHLVPETASAMVFMKNGAGEDYVSFDHVILDRFEADGNVAAGALLKGGVVTYVNGERVDIPTSSQVREISVRNGDIGFIEGQSGQSILKFASQSVLVKAASGAKQLSGHLVRISGSANVYLAASDGKRYLFPSQGQFFGWYADFASVRVVSSQSLSGIQIGGKALYRPGYRLVRAVNSPRVYAVGDNGVLHWVQSEDVLIALFGREWYHQMDLMSDVDLADYIQGSAISDLSKYYLALN
ncbi:MAG: hypothetical protein WCT10_03735 [Patescibacteria group bacterium]|jgi:hypothetical protein